MHDIEITGCAPLPLAAYLKAFGLLQIVANQADSEAAGGWRDDTFILRSRLSRDPLIEFLLEQYRPAPILAPWNGGSGFSHGPRLARTIQ